MGSQDSSSTTSRTLAVAWIAEGDRSFGLLLAISSYYHPTHCLLLLCSQIFSLAMEKNPSGGMLYCDGCGGREFDADDDGFFYCRQCGCQNQEMVVTGCADEDIRGEGAPYSIFRHRARPHSDGAAPRDQILRPYEPRDFGARPCPDAETLVGGIRLRYVQGMQVMVQLQCESLVERFGVSPLICGIVPDIWLRYVALSRVFDDKWVKKVIAESKTSSKSNARDGQPGKFFVHAILSLSDTEPKKELAESCCFSLHLSSIHLWLQKGKNLPRKQRITPK